jgi:hypothetical protein
VLPYISFWRQESTAINIAGFGDNFPTFHASAAHFRQTEVQNLDAAPFRYEDVPRLDVTMDDSLLMRRFESVGYLDGKFQYPFECSGPS